MISRIQLRQFLAVVDAGSFTKAAAALNIAQPSLSAGIAELERQLGNRLFVRERRRIRLTQAGNALLPLSRSIEQGFWEVETKIGSLPVPVRPIRIGVLDTIPSRWLESALTGCVAGADLEVIEGTDRELTSAMANGTLDIALTLLADGPRSDNEELLFSEDYCLALPASHPLASTRSVRAEALASETMIARRQCEGLAYTSRFFTDRGVRPRFSLRSNHDERAMAMVRAGLGVTVAPRSFGGEGIAIVSIDEFGLRRNIGLVYSTEWDKLYSRNHLLIRALRLAA